MITSRTMIHFCVLLGFLSISGSLTPPRIIYGGWTPILPGHPFHFGPVRRRNNVVEDHVQNHQTPDNQIRYHPEHPFPESPIQHDIEHHFEHHIEFVEPQQHYPQQHSPSTGGGDAKDGHAQYDPREAYPQGKGQPQQYVYGHKPEKDAYAHFHADRGGGAKDGQAQKAKSHPQFDRPNKNIFAYYPPQSAYEGPKPLDLDYKPVYFETPRKPLDVFENTGQYVLRDVPVKSLGFHDLNSIDEKTYLKITPLVDVDPGVLKHIGAINLDQLRYLDHGAVKFPKYPVIKDSSGGIPNYPVLKDSSLPKYPVIKHSSGGLSNYPRPVQYASLTYGKHDIPVTKLHYGELPYKLREPTGYKSANNYKGSEFSLENYSPLKRPLNPIETKKFSDSHLRQKHLGKRVVPKPKSYGDLSSVLSRVTSSPPVYPSNPKHATKTSGDGYAKPSPTLLGKDLATQVRNYLNVPKLFQYTTPVQPFHPKTVLPRSVYPYRPLPKTLLHLPLRTMPPHPVVVVPNLGTTRPIAPTLLQKDAKMQTLYRNIRGSPALVEREVAILHLPVQQEYVRYPNDKEYLYLTASTPESTQVLDLDKSNGSIPYMTLNKHAPLFGHPNESHIAFEDYEGDKHDSEQSTFGDSALESPPRGTDVVDNDLSGRHRNEFQYIFVSSGGVHPDAEDSRSHSPQTSKKQFFHAYHAPGHHVPPPGYVKMTVGEFSRLFKNAEIRYVDRDPAAEPLAS